MSWGSCWKIHVEVREQNIPKGRGLRGAVGRDPRFLPEGVGRDPRISREGVGRDPGILREGVGSTQPLEVEIPVSRTYYVMILFVAIDVIESHLRVSLLSPQRSVTRHKNNTW